jgi:hypothetical protein
MQKISGDVEQRNSLSLLLGMQNGSATLEDSLVSFFFSSQN